MEVSRALVGLCAGCLGACNAIWGTDELDYTAGGGGSVAGPELCTDGVDNDGDGAVDCADTDCEVGYACVPAPPAGALGLAFVRTNDGSAPLPCGGAAPPVQLWRDFQPTASTCTCGCSAPTDASCSVAQLFAYAGAACTSTASSIPTGCRDVTGDAAISGSIIMDSVGSCSAGAELAPASGGSFLARLDVCVLSEVGGGCETGSVCGPTSPTGYEPPPCVLSVATAATPETCDDAPFVVAELGAATAKVEDTRACDASACTCDAVAGQQCLADSLWYDGAQCQGTPTEAVLNGGCTEKPAGMLSLSISAAHSDGGSCLAGGTAPLTGSAVPSWSHLLCCVAP